MRNFIQNLLLTFGALTIINFGQGIAEKILLAVCSICVCIAGAMAVKGE